MAACLLLLAGILSLLSGVLPLAGLIAMVVAVVLAAGTRQAAEPDIKTKLEIGNLLGRARMQSRDPGGFSETAEQPLVDLAFAGDVHDDNDAADRLARFVEQGRGGQSN